jgi:hypothetical protein
MVHWDDTQFMVTGFVSIISATFVGGKKSSSILKSEVDLDGS